MRVGGGRGAARRAGAAEPRGEAGRARAVLWSLAGETSAAIAARLGVRPEQVRRWRGAFRSGGAAALRSRPRRRGAARDLLGDAAPDRSLRTPARLAREVAARAGGTISPGHPGVVPRRGAPAGAAR